MQNSNGGQLLTAGACVIATEGEYSDYNVKGILYILRDIDTRVVLAEFKEEFHIADDEARTDADADADADAIDNFMAWLIRAEYATEMPATEWHLGKYGDLGDLGRYGRG